MPDQGTIRGTRLANGQQRDVYLLESLHPQYPRLPIAKVEVYPTAQIGEDFCRQFFGWNRNYQHTNKYELETMAKIPYRLKFETCPELIFATVINDHGYTVPVSVLLMERFEEDMMKRVMTLLGVGARDEANIAIKAALMAPFQLAKASGIIITDVCLSNMAWHRRRQTALISDFGCATTVVVSILLNFYFSMFGLI